jgi:hypothetical protein
MPSGRARGIPHRAQQAGKSGRETSNRQAVTASETEVWARQVAGTEVALRSEE